MIKKIHYIWLGGKKKPRIIEKCIRSWKKNMPDWEIIEWNESNLNIDINKFCRQAYDAKKYAFAADVLRFDILYKQGGLYFDTDVKVIKSLFPLIEKGESFTGYEINGSINPGLVLYVSEPNNSVIKEVLDIYDKSYFVNKDGSYNYKVVGEYFVDAITKNGELNIGVEDPIRGFRIYPSTYFSPRDSYRSILNFSKNTYSEHLFAASWLPLKERIPIYCRRGCYLLLKPKGMKVCKRLIEKIGIFHFGGE